MSRRFQEIEGEERKRSFATIKDALLTMEPDMRRYVLSWLCRYFNDAGDLYSPSVPSQRERVTIRGIEYWLVQVPKRR